MHDVAPDALRERIRVLLDDSAMVPGVLALSAARAVEDGDGPSVGRGGPNGGEDPRETTGSDGGTVGGPGSASDPAGGGNAAGPVGIEERAAGVQLIYEGLRLTRALADEPPWEREPPHTDSNVDVLAADVMVARGFSLLARTEAADKAVATVQSFGRDETDGQQGRPASPHALETDVFELAMLAGATAFGVRPSEALLAYAAELAASLEGDRPEPPEALPAEVEQAMGDVPDPRRFVPADDARPSATDP
uniref:DUF7114 family protein n=1 Tax=Halorussus halobius TaxID=1710537 RepID=UPI001B2FF1AF|nr:hypothetical protein [Halorussus halobius]